MLGVSGQAKNIHKRDNGIMKLTEKFPVIPVNKATAVVTTGNKSKAGKPHTATKRVVNKKPSPKEEQVLTEKKSVGNEMTILEVAKLRLHLPAGAIGDCGSVKVKFSHYNKSFPIHNGVLKWEDIDEEYCISFVYRGNYIRNLVAGHAAHISEEKANDEHNIVDGRRYAKTDDNFTYYINIADKSEYTLEVIEDPIAGIGAEGLRLSTGPLKSGELSRLQNTPSVKSTTRAMDAITAELKSIPASELNAAHAKDLIERRDIEDILFSG